MPKVSVIIPVYGVEKYIERCARSLFEQTLDDIEYIFIDDCTPDNSIRILHSVLQEYPRRKNQVRIHRMEQNSGQAIVRNKALELATGTYIIHCDSDDWVDLRMYEKLLYQAESQNADVVFCDYYKAITSNETYAVHKSIRDCRKETLMSCAFTGYELNTLWNALVRKQLYEGITSPVSPQGEDKTYMIQIIWNSHKCVYLPECLYFYRDNPTSITNMNSVDSVIKKHMQFLDNQKIILQFIRDNSLDKLFREEIIAYKLNGKLGLYYSLSNNECKKLWKETYPEINNRVFTNRYISIKVKVLCLIALLKTCC